MDIAVSVSPYLIIVGLVLLLRRSDRLRQDEDTGGDLHDNHRGNYQLAERRSRYDGELDNTAKADDEAGHPSHAKSQGRSQKKKRRSPLQRFLDFLTFMSLVIGICGSAASLTTFFNEDAPDQLAQFKSRDAQRFGELIAAADEHSANGELELAKAANGEALRVPSIPMIDMAQPLANIADILVKQAQFDRAFWPAMIAADLRSEEADLVNPFAEVLIENCELDQATDRLDGLDINQDLRSRQLLERIEARRSECSER